MAPKVYWHRPWLIAQVVIGAFLLVVGVTLAPLLVSGSVEDTAKAILGLPLVALALFALVLSAVRTRTTVDDTGITQQGATRSFRMDYADITGIELDHGLLGWYLRVRCGERTFAVLPCNSVLGSRFVIPPGPPRTLRAAMDDIESRARRFSESAG
jgi:hypothetical protein